MKNRKSRFLPTAKKLPLWGDVARALTHVLELAFGCQHRMLSRVFTIRGRSYKVCCQCGATFSYSLRPMSIVPRHGLFSALKRLPHVRKMHNSAKWPNNA